MEKTKQKMKRTRKSSSMPSTKSILSELDELRKKITKAWDDKSVSQELNDQRAPEKK